MKKIIACFFMLICHQGFSQDYFSKNHNRLLLDNEVVQRKMVFSQGAPEVKRTVFLKDLIPDEHYTIRQAPSGEVVHKATGGELMHTEGFPVQMKEEYKGKIYEVRIE